VLVSVRAAAVTEYARGVDIRTRRLIVTGLLLLMIAVVVIAALVQSL
jgi:hypothetical protein